MKALNRHECEQISGAFFPTVYIPPMVVLDGFDGTSALLKIFYNPNGVTFYGFDSQNSKIQFKPTSNGYSTTSTNCVVTEVAPIKYNWGAMHNDYFVEFL